MANKFTMKETNVENKIIYKLIVGYFTELVTKDRLLAYETFDRYKKAGYKDIILKKVTTNIETEYLERG